MRKQSTTSPSAVREAPLAAYLDRPAVRLLAAVLVAGITFVVLRWSMAYLKSTEVNRLQLLLVAVVTGIGAVWALYWSADTLLSALPLGIFRDRLRPVIFVGPALALLIIYLVYPTIMTIWMSFRNRNGSEFIGLDNYITAFTTETIQSAFINNLLWLVIVTSLSVGLGMIIAVLIDKVRYESVAKSLIFLPMAISFVGASVIWKFVYAYQPAGRPQTGILNAVVTAAGGDPVGWLIQRQFNNFALMAIMIWLQTGFCLVILSAALKGIPTEVIDAARIDGANEGQLFFQVIIPMLKGTLITVATTVLIAVLKVFDIVYVMTGGKYDTDVIANVMFQEKFKNSNDGLASALAVVLLVAVVPVMIINVRNLRRQRSM